MSDCQPAVLPYSEALKSGMPKYAALESGHDSYAKEMITGMYTRSLQSIRNGTAIYKEVVSKHRPIVDGSEGGRLHACFCPRNSRLPPIETWMVALSHFKPDGSDERYYVVDRAALMLPTTFGNYMQQIELGVMMLSYLQQEFSGQKLLYPAVALEEKKTGTKANIAVSRDAVNEVHRGKVELQLGPNNSFHFYKL